MVEIPVDSLSKSLYSMKSQYLQELSLALPIWFLLTSYFYGYPVFIRVKLNFRCQAISRKFVS